MAPGTYVTLRAPETDTAIGQGAKNVTTAGTPLQLSATSTPCIEVLIQAKRTNTGRIYVGGAAVTNDDTTGIYLELKDSIRLSASNLNQIYLNSSVSGEGVTYIYWNN